MPACSRMSSTPSSLKSAFWQMRCRIVCWCSLVYLMSSPNRISFSTAISLLALSTAMLGYTVVYRILWYSLFLSRKVRSSMLRKPISEVFSVSSPRRFSASRLTSSS